MPRLSPAFPRPQRRSAKGVAAISQAAFETLEDRRLLSVSVVSTVNGSNGLGNGTSREPSVSADGRFVVFSSSASNLAANDTNNVADVYLRDTQNSTTTLISVNSAGTAAATPRARSRRSARTGGSFPSRATRAT